MAEKDDYITEVMFRRYSDPSLTKLPLCQIFAIFPHQVETYYGNVATYEHVGQHSHADYSRCIRISKPASEEDYADLKKELEGLGYNLKQIRRMSHSKYIKDLKEKFSK